MEKENTSFITGISDKEYGILGRESTGQQILYKVDFFIFLLSRKIYGSYLL